MKSKTLYDYLLATAIAVTLACIAGAAEPPRLFSVRNCMSGGCGQATETTSFRVRSRMTERTSFRVTNRVEAPSPAPAPAVIVAPAPAVSQTTVRAPSVSQDCSSGTCSVQQQTTATRKVILRLFR